MSAPKILVEQEGRTDGPQIVIYLGVPKLLGLLEDIQVDALVVGAGPAGLMAARALARGGSGTLIVEKSAEIGYPVHTSGGSWIKEMNNFHIPTSLYNPIKNAVFASVNSEAEFRLKQETACVLRVREMYQYLATLAIEAGSDMLVSTHARDAVIHDGSLVALASSKGRDLKVRSKLCVDATGFSAVISRSLNKGAPWRRYGVGAEYEAWVESADPTTVTFIVGNDIAPGGYAWIFPLDEHRARIGVGVVKPETKLDPFPFLEKLLRSAYLKDLGRIKPLEFHLGSTPADGPIAKSTGERLLIAGDAAGQVSPHIGEGIRFAMSLGAAAGEAGSRALQTGDDNDEDFAGELAKYDEECRSRIGSSFQIALILQKRLASLSDERWDSAVEELSMLSGDEFVNILRADFTGRFLFRLVASHPLLLASATLKAIVKRFN